MDQDVAELRVMLTRVARSVKYRTDGNGRGLEVDDLVQHALFAIWRNLDEIMSKEHRRSKEGYLRQYARLAMLDAVREWGGRGNGYLDGSMVTSDDPRMADQIGAALDELADVDASKDLELSQIVAEWWRNLDWLQKRIVMDMAGEGLTGRAIAAKLRTVESAVSVRISRARCDLQTRLGVAT